MEEARVYALVYFVSAFCRDKTPSCVFSGGWQQAFPQIQQYVLLLYGCVSFVGGKGCAVLLVAFFFFFFCSKLSVVGRLCLSPVSYIAVHGKRNFVFVHFAVISSFVLVAEAGFLHIYVFGAKIYICVSRGKTNCVRFPRVRFIELYDRDCHHVLFVVRSPTWVAGFDLRKSTMEGYATKHRFN